MADQTGFVSLDCGTNSNYTDTATTLDWTSDSTGFGLTDVSNAFTVQSPLNNPPTQFNSIRYFPGEQSKYCYVFNGPDHGVQQTKAYLIRASFWLGGGQLPFDTLSKQQITFQLLINADHWDDISIGLPQTDTEGAVVKEMYMVADSPTISVCLAGRGIGLDTPFISSLELRPLRSDMTAVQLLGTTGLASKALFLQYRINYGSSTNNDVRYPDDVFDRIWAANTTRPWLNTSHSINTDISEDPPSIVMQTAYMSNDSFNINFIDFTGTHGYFYMLYFSEISSQVTAPGQRVFDETTFNGTFTMSSSSIDLYSNETNSLYGVVESFNTNILIVQEGGYLNFSFQKSFATSIYGPLICALELQRLSDAEMSLSTLQSDATALDTMKEAFQGFDSWSGDPCLPYAYNWLTCSLTSPPRIVTLLLSKQNLTGEIPSSINNLTALVKIDLQGNTFNGVIPEFLANLPNLMILLLQDNNFSGVIPQALLAKVASSGLNFSYAGNPYLCTTTSNQSYCLEQAKTILTKKSHVPLVIGLTMVGALVVLIVLGGFFFFFRRRKNYIPHSTTIVADGISVVPLVQVVEYSNPSRCFSYKEIKAITNDFTFKIGQGGFGPVFHGVLSNEMHVAVKVLSRDSLQGVQEFLNEVALLSRAHHRNLVQLIGYCIEKSLVLVYEYMSNGSLHQLLHGGKSGKQLAWRDRLKIAVSSADGLEYLHKGCNPRIIHRDVKSRNILLDDEMEGKISDFGISRSTYDLTQTVTEVQGSAGYIDQEYFQTKRINERTDVYAFGIVLLEIVCGRLPIIRSGHIVDWVRPLVERGHIDAIVDAAIANDYNVSSMWKVIDVAMRCVEPHSNERPHMSEVSSELKSALSMELKNDLAATSKNPYDMDVHPR